MLHLQKNENGENDGSMITQKPPHWAIWALTTQNVARILCHLKFLLDLTVEHSGDAFYRDPEFFRLYRFTIP